jgi:hypothetical protein
MQPLCQPPSIRSFLCAPLLTLALLTSCASGVAFTPVTIVPITTSESRPFVTMTKNTDIHLDTGYARILKAGSEWRRIGSIAQGDIYKARDAVFTLEGAHIHEASLVIADGNLTGFYLPVEHGFSPLKHPIALPLSSTPQ